MMHTVAKVSRACKARVNSQSDFSIRIFRMSFLLLRKIPKNQSLFAVGGPGASERGVKKNHDLIRNLKS
mgnify:CR=1 FL=1